MLSQQGFSPEQISSMVQVSVAQVQANIDRMNGVPLKKKPVAKKPAVKKAAKKDPDPNAPAELLLETPASKPVKAVVAGGGEAEPGDMPV